MWLGERVLKSRKLLDWASAVTAITCQPKDYQANAISGRRVAVHLHARYLPEPAPARSKKFTVMRFISPMQEPAHPLNTNRAERPAHAMISNARATPQLPADDERVRPGMRSPQQ